MIVRENPNGSVSPIMEGCDSDFIDKLPAHLVFVKELLQGQALMLNGTLEQLKDIECFLAANRHLPEVHTPAFFQGLVAYCGELLRVAIPGDWTMVVSKASAAYSEDRYFPSIVDDIGQEYTFSACVENELAFLLRPELNWDKMDGLYYAMLFQLHSRIKLPVQKMTSWFFPPLDNNAAE